MLRDLCVEREQWLEAGEFDGAVSACNLLPGPASTQLAIFCAWRLRGRPSALVGGAAFILPGLVVILALAALFLTGSPPRWVTAAPERAPGPRSPSRPGAGCCPPAGEVPAVQAGPGRPAGLPISRRHRRGSYPRAVAGARPSCLRRERLIGRVSHRRAAGLKALFASVLAFGILGVIGIWYPQLFGNGKDMADDAFLGIGSIGPGSPWSAPLP